ncbi:hypothetical protein FQZ97_730630 [compost metagenome]
MSSARIISAASLVTSVPLIPMATPISAFFSAGASFTPSPVIATICLCAWMAFTRRSLCSGLARAKTSTFCTVSCSAASFISSISAPVTAVLPSPIPSILAIAAAVIL